MISCVICERCFWYLLRDGLRLCKYCYAELRLSYFPRYLQWRHKKSNIWHYGLSLFKYEGVIRDLILKIKVQKDSVALLTFLAFLEEEDLISQWLYPAQIYTAPPASLYSRLRLKLDLAGATAQRFSIKRNKAFMHFGFALHNMNFSKQSFLTSKQRIGEQQKSLLVNDYEFLPSQDAVYPLQVPKPYPCIAIFDDVVTSGQTLGSVLSHMGSASCRIVVLACAR